MKLRQRFGKERQEMAKDERPESLNPCLELILLKKMAIWRAGMVSGGKGRCVGPTRVTMGYLGVTMGLPDNCLLSYC